MNGAGLAVLLLLAADVVQDDSFDRTVDALAVGSAAIGAGDRTRLHRAAIELSASGATPLPRGEDVAARWLAKAGRLAKSGRGAPAPFRDRALGPGYLSIRLKRDGVWRLDQTFLAGRRARVAVVNAASGSFALQIIDDDRQTVCRASSLHRQCDWVPAYTARFTIEMRNPGPQPGQYFVIMQ